jgi:hypothetical protein
MGFREAVDEQGLEEAKRDSTIDGAARSEGDEQGISAPGGSFNALRGTLYARQPAFQLDDSIGVGRRLRLCRDRRLGDHPLGRSRRSLNRSDAEESRCLIVARKRPSGAHCTCED